MAKMSRKGIFYTFSLTLIVLVILGFTIVVLNESYNQKSGFRDLAALERVNIWHSSISDDANTLFGKYSNISVTISNSTARFNEIVPANRDKFVAEMQQYENFVENQTSEVELNFTETTNKLALQINPGNFTYTHPGGISGNSIQLEPRNLLYDFYNVSIATSASFNESGCISNFIAGSKNISVRIFVVNNASIDCKYNGTFDPAQNHTLSVTNGSSVLLEPPYGKLTITSGGGSINATTEVGLNLNNSKINIFYPEPALFINLSQLNVTRSAGIRLM